MLLRRLPELLLLALLLLLDLEEPLLERELPDPLDEDPLELERLLELELDAVITHMLA